MGIASCRLPVADSVTPLIMNIQFLFLVCLFRYVIAYGMFVEHLQWPAATAPTPRAPSHGDAQRCHYWSGTISLKVNSFVIVFSLVLKRSSTGSQGT